MQKVVIVLAELSLSAFVKEQAVPSINTSLLTHKLSQPSEGYLWIIAPEECQPKTLMWELECLEGYHCSTKWECDSNSNLLAPVERADRSLPRR